MRFGILVFRLMMAGRFWFCFVLYFSSFLSGGFSFTVISTRLVQNMTFEHKVTVNLCSSLIWGSCRFRHRVDSVLGYEGIFPLLPPWAYSSGHSSWELVGYPFFFFQHPFTSKGASLQSLVSDRHQAGFRVALSSSPLQYFSSYYPHRSLVLVLPPVGSPSCLLRCLSYF